MSSKHTLSRRDLLLPRNCPYLQHACEEARTSANNRPGNPNKYDLTRELLSCTFYHALHLDGFFLFPLEASAISTSLAEVALGQDDGAGGWAYNDTFLFSHSHELQSLLINFC